MKLSEAMAELLALAWLLLFLSVLVFAFSGGDLEGYGWQTNGASDAVRVADGLSGLFDGEACLLLVLVAVIVTINAEVDGTGVPVLLIDLVFVSDIDSGAPDFEGLDVLVTEDG